MIKRQNHYSYLSRLMVFLLAFFALSLTAQAQPATGDETQQEEVSWPHHLTLGLGGGVNLNFPKGTYVLDNYSYSSGFGVAPTFFGLLEIPLGGKWMLVPRIHYSNISGAFTDGTTTGATVANFDKFAYDVQNVGLDVLGKYAISNFQILFGPSIATIVTKTYAHGTSNDASASGTDLPGSHSVFAAIGAGVGYDIPINKKNSVWLSPEAFYSYPLTNLGDGSSDLKVSTLRVAVSVKFDISPEPPPPPPPAHPITMTVSARGILPNGDVSNEPVIPEQASRTRSSVPLLPYIFFDNGSAEIPARYSRNGATGFTEMQLEGKDAMEVNHEILDVIGSRMKQNPEIKITVTGTNSNSGAERGKIDLSKQRAMAVRDYLVKTWGIAGSRITVDQRNLPELPTNPVTKAGMEENRRVEISSTDPRITDPVKIENKKSESVGETQIRYETTMMNPDNIAISGWKISLDQNGTPIGSAESGPGAPPKVLSSKIPDAMRYEGQPVHYQIEVTDVNGKKYTADGMTRVVKKTVEHANLEKYAMLSFDFDRSEVNERAQKMINLIGESVTMDANGLNVSGFCDNTGTDEYNQALSEARAQSAVAALRSATRLPANTNVNAHGKRDPKFVNELPEGRMLNRRVEVDISKSNK
ncbi:MAG: OmpA family protein [Bacteroidota bacterium]|nr:OmpA family protein [Bacteroidota bacterium]MDP4230017.1 OmpA family protein [Bacteroidota bacterium]MDP4234826.1 OmpA family protein [Bacteroidota bacterium]